jgi:anti-sigma factor RsiW
MKPIGCIKTGFLVERRAAGLSQSERLRLEEHLTTCDACNREAETLAALADLITTVQSPITPTQRNRAIRNALDLPLGAPARPAKRKLVFSFACAAVVSAAVAAAWVLFFHPSNTTKPVVALQPSRAEVVADRVVSGEVISENQTIPAGGFLDGRAFFETNP